ncbi:MAG: hypothetical protein LBP88_06510 [Treponema sp.]|jgi:hypothetical protein|nr:hypothetical protein [Treponema sp.]
MTDMDRAIEEAKAAVLPFESWERLPGESGLAYAAFCAFRDLGLERNIRKAAICYANRSEFDGRGGATTEQRQGTKPSNSTQTIEKRYRVWRNWAAQFRWRERAADYDRYMEKLKQAEMRKTIEAQGEKHRAVTGKMLTVVEKKLDLMNPADLTQSTVTEWVETAIRAERD